MSLVVEVERRLASGHYHLVAGARHPLQPAPVHAALFAAEWCCNSPQSPPGVWVGVPGEGEDLTVTDPSRFLGKRQSGSKDLNVDVV